MKLRTAAIVGITLLGFVSFVRWRTDQPPAPRWRFVVVIDRSASFSRRCSSLLHLVRSAVEATPVSVTLDLVVLQTGDSLSAFEPQLVELPPVPQRTTRFLEQDHVADSIRHAFLRTVISVCDRMTVTDISPVYVASRRAFDLVNSKGFIGASTIAVGADFEETALRDLRKALSSTGAAPSVPRFDNGATDLVLCGYSATRSVLDTDGRSRRGTALRDPARIDRLDGVWRQLLSHPDRVVMEPYCETVTIRLPASLNP